MNKFINSQMYNHIINTNWCVNCPIRKQGGCTYTIEKLPKQVKMYLEQIPIEQCNSSVQDIYEISYEDFKYNFISYWQAMVNYDRDLKKALEEILDEAIDKFAEEQEDNYPELSFVLYGYGYLKADNLIKAIDKARKLILLGNKLSERQWRCR